MTWHHKTKMSVEALVWGYIHLVRNMPIYKYRNICIPIQYIYCKVVYHTKNVKQFFFHYISIFYSSNAYYQKKYYKYPKLHCKMQKMLLNS